MLVVISWGRSLWGRKNDLFLPHRDSLWGRKGDHFLPHRDSLWGRKGDHFLPHRDSLWGRKGDHFLPHRDSLWGRKDDHFLPHRELPNMTTTTTTTTTTKYIHKPQLRSCAREHRRLCEAHQFWRKHRCTYAFSFWLSTLKQKKGQDGEELSNIAASMERTNDDKCKWRARSWFDLTRMRLQNQLPARLEFPP